MLAQLHRRRGHYNVFTLESLLALIDWTNTKGLTAWDLVETEKTDSKVDNGHTVIYQVHAAVYHQ